MQGTDTSWVRFSTLLRGGRAPDQVFPGRSGWPERNVTEVLIWGQGTRGGQ